VPVSPKFYISTALPSTSKQFLDLLPVSPRSASSQSSTTQQVLFQPIAWDPLLSLVIVVVSFWPHGCKIKAGGMKSSGGKQLATSARNRVADFKGKGAW
jgi:hypothetical protein